MADIIIIIGIIFAVKKMSENKKKLTFQCDNELLLKYKYEYKKYGKCGRPRQQTVQKYGQSRQERVQ